MASAFFTTIYVVTVKRNNGSGSRCWYWDRDEAENMYESAVDEIGGEATVTLYSTDVQQTINDYLDEAVEAAGSGNSTLQELRSNRAADAEPELEWDGPRVNGTDLIYMEVAYGGDYWGYDIIKTNESTWGLRVDGYADDPSSEVGTVAVIGDLLPMYVARGSKGDQIGMFSTLEDGFKAVIKRSHGKA